MKTRNPAIFVSISCLFYSLTLCWLVYRYLNGAIDSGEYFNSDALFLPSLFKNIFSEGGLYSDWVLPPSSYLFPDTLVYSVAYVLSKHISTQILIFSVLQSLLFFSLISVLLGFFIPRLGSISYSALISSNIILLGLYSSDPYALSFISAFHFGSLLSFLILLILLLKFLSATSAKGKYFFATLTLFLSTCSILSDRLVLIQFVLPVLLIGMYYSFAASNNKEILKGGLLLIIGFPLAWLIEKAFLPEMGKLESGIGYGSISNKLPIIFNWAIKEPWLIQLSIFLFPIAFSISFLFLLQNKEDIDQHVAQKRLVAFLFLCSAALMLLIIGLSDRDFTSRYLLPYFILSPVFLFIFLSESKSKLLVVTLIFLSFLSIFAATVKKSTQIPFCPEFVRCIDELTQKYNVSRGVAQYWDAIPLNVFSNRGLIVAPVFDDVSPMRWIYNTSEFVKEFSFAVIDNSTKGIYKISRAAIDTHLSKKPFEYQCNDKTVLIFNNETITLPSQSPLSNIKSSALESFIQNPRALLIMAQEETKKGNYEASSRLLSEAINLLIQSGADDKTVKYYESVKKINLSQISQRLHKGE